MKKLLMSSLVLIVFSISIVLFQLSCTKSATGQTTALTKDQILVAKTWKVDKLSHVISGQYSSYTSGGGNTTGVNYDNTRFTFKDNGTGINIDATGTTYNFTWQFTSADKRTLQLTLNGRTDTWDMVEIADNYLHATVNIILGANTNNIEAFRLKQLP
jgi:hypothetical protein